MVSALRGPLVVAHVLGARAVDQKGEGLLQGEGVRDRPVPEEGAQKGKDPNPHEEGEDREKEGQPPHEALV